MARWDEEQQRWVHDPPPGAPAGSPPAPVLPQPAGPPGEAGRRAAIVAVVVLLVCGAAGAGLWALTGGHDGGPTAGQPPAVVVTPSDLTGTDDGTDDGTDGGGYGDDGSGPTDDSGSSDDDSGSSSDDSAPDGYEQVDDPAGFTLDVPEEWTRSTSGVSSIYYTSPEGEHFIQIYTVDASDGTPYDALSTTESTVSSYDDYTLIDLSRTDDGPQDDAARLEYTYLRDNGVTRHVVDRAFTAADGTQYALLVAGPDDDWQACEDVFRTVVDSFCPDGYSTD